MALGHGLAKTGGLGDISCGAFWLVGEERQDLNCAAGQQRE